VTELRMKIRGYISCLFNAGARAIRSRTKAVVRGGRANREQLKQAVTQKLAGDNVPDREQRDSAAREMRSQAATLNRRTFGLSRIEHVIDSTDHELLAPLVNEIADILSPETADEPVELGIF